MWGNAILLIFSIFAFSSSWAQNYYTKEEIDLKLELQHERINSYLDAVDRENNSIDAKIAAQDKQIAHQDKQIENVRFLFGILLSFIGIVAAVAAFFIDKRNKDRFKSMLAEMEDAEEGAMKELNRIKDIVNMEIKMAHMELNDTIEEKKLLEDEIAEKTGKLKKK